MTELFNTQLLKTSGVMFIKFGSIILLILYCFYAFIIVKQVNLMAQTIELSMKRTLKVIAVFHLMFAISLLLYAILM